MPSDGITYSKFLSPGIFYAIPWVRPGYPKIRVTLHVASIHYLKDCPPRDLATKKIRLHNIFEIDLAQIFVGNPMALHIRKLRPTTIL